jgi:hypothetical protein
MLKYIIIANSFGYGLRSERSCVHDGGRNNQDPKGRRSALEINRS